MLTPDERERYARHLLLPQIGEAGQLKLQGAKVLCIGAGGLGSPALFYLAAAGVGRIGVVDADVVDTSNLQRQILHGGAVGRAKVDSAAAKLRALNPHVQIDTFRTQLSSANALEIFAPYVIIVDGTDNFPARYLINDACEMLGKPFVYGSILRFEGQISVFNHNGGPTYRDLFPDPPPPGSVPSCSEAGVLGVLPGVVGSIQATEVLKLILGIGEPLSGRLMLYNALDMRFRELSFARDPERSAPTELIDYHGYCGLRTPEPFVNITPQELRMRRAQGWQPYVLDVRSESEWDAGHLPFADARVTHTEVAAADVPADRDVVLVCRSGGRSGAAGRVLAAAGHDRLFNLDGGMLAWNAS